MARDEGHEAKVVLSVARNDVWTAHSLVKNMVMHGFVSWLVLSREYDSMRGVDRTLAYQRSMNPEPSETKEQAISLIWERRGFVRN